ncbi:MAG TPA: hypothetical protein VL360_00295 [Gammaproteobacteria bacterium]|nr:hypothetical protein [Gammaproteobacteria bacterium]
MQHNKKKVAATSVEIDEEYVQQKINWADQILEEAAKNETVIDPTPIIEELEMISKVAPKLVDDYLTLMLTQCYWLRGNNLYAAGKARQAYQDFKKLAGLKAKNKEFHKKYIEYYVVLLKKIRRTTPANKFLSKCINDMNDLISGALKLGGKETEVFFDIAISELKVIRNIAPDLHPDNVNQLLASAYYYRGLLRKKMGDADLAFRDLLKAQKLLPDDDTIAEAIATMKPASKKDGIGLFKKTLPAQAIKPVAKKPESTEVQPATASNPKPYVQIGSKNSAFYKHSSPHVPKNNSFNNEQHFNVKQPGGRTGSGGKK